MRQFSISRFSCLGTYTQRDMLLAACDWTQLPDVPLTDEQKIAWQAYRQALRDLPQTYSDPDAVAWPEPPGD